MSEHCQTELLSDYLDDELDGAVRGALEHHLERCASCASVLADLRNVTRQAGALVDRSPPRDLWPGIASRIGASPSPVSIRSSKARRISFSVPQLLAAGLAALVIGGSATAIGGGMFASPSEAPGSEAPVGDAVPASFATLAVETPYDRAIEELTAILQRDRGRLHPRTVRALEENLAVIDGAIERAREALLQDPESDYFRDHLDRTVRQKLDLLRRASNIVSRS